MRTTTERSHSGFSASKPMISLKRSRVGGSQRQALQDSERQMSTTRNDNSSRRHRSHDVREASEGARTTKEKEFSTSHRRKGLKGSKMGSRQGKRSKSHDRGARGAAGKGRKATSKPQRGRSRGRPDSHQGRRKGRSKDTKVRSRSRGRGREKIQRSWSLRSRSKSLDSQGRSRLQESKVPPKLSGKQAHKPMKTLKSKVVRQNTPVEGRAQNRIPAIQSNASEASKRIVAIMPLPEGMDNDIPQPVDKQKQGMFSRWKLPGLRKQKQKQVAKESAAISETDYEEVSEPAISPVLISSSSSDSSQPEQSAAVSTVSGRSGEQGRSTATSYISETLGAPRGAILFQDDSLDDSQDGTSPLEGATSCLLCVGWSVETLTAAIFDCTFYVCSFGPSCSESTSRRDSESFADSTSNNMTSVGRSHNSPHRRMRPRHSSAKPRRQEYAPRPRPAPDRDDNTASGFSMGSWGFGCGDSVESGSRGPEADTVISSLSAGSGITESEFSVPHSVLAEVSVHRAVEKVLLSKYPGKQSVPQPESQPEMQAMLQPEIQSLEKPVSEMSKLGQSVLPPNPDFLRNNAAMEAPNKNERIDIATNGEPVNCAEPKPPLRTTNVLSEEQPASIEENRDAMSIPKNVEPVTRVPSTATVLCSAPAPNEQERDSGNTNLDPVKPTDEEAVMPTRATTNGTPTVTQLERTSTPGTTNEEWGAAEEQESGSTTINNVPKKSAEEERERNSKRDASKRQLDEWAVMEAKLMKVLKPNSPAVDDATTNSY